MQAESVVDMGITLFVMALFALCIFMAFRADTVETDRNLYRAYAEAACSLHQPGAILIHHNNHLVCIQEIH